MSPRTTTPKKPRATKPPAAAPIDALEAPAAVAVAEQPAPRFVAGVLVPVGHTFVRCRCCGFGWADNRPTPVACPSCGPGYRSPAGHPAEG